MQFVLSVRNHSIISSCVSQITLERTVACSVEYTNDRPHRPLVSTCSTAEGERDQLVMGGVELFEKFCFAGLEENTKYDDASYWATFFILFNNFLPLSLYVTLEIVNFVQAYYVDQDLEMYDAEQDTPALARTSNQNGDLGQEGTKKTTTLSKFWTQQN